MIDPQLVFQEPDKYLDEITSSSEVEGQYFDRKEVRNVEKGISAAKKNIKECISAFANARGGILVLGVDDNGKVVGLNHLKETEYNSFTQILQEGLINHQSRTREFFVDDKKLLLIYTPEALYGICETSESSPKSWKREGANNLPLTSNDRERLIIEKSRKYEQLEVCEFSNSLIDQPVFEAFKRSYQQDRSSNYQYDDVDFLKIIGACKSVGDRLLFTNAGFLFFASNPRSYIPSSYVRFLKYDSDKEEGGNPGAAIFDEDFDGCIPALLQKIRTFVKNGAFFKRYSYRDPRGSGIIEEPEYPYAAAEEAIVNAIIHRDYNSPQPITCIAYKDSFLVKNPGRISQPSHIPTHFTLENQTLEPYPRNPKIVEWARVMQDENGQRFVKALSEGTRTMLDAMNKLQLPPPSYKTNGITSVMLKNDARKREAKFRQLPGDTTTEYTNLYPFLITFREGSSYDINDLKNSILELLRNKLENSGWFIDRSKHARIIAHRKGNKLTINGRVNDFLQIFPAFVYQIYSFDNKLYLSIDYTIQIKNITNLEKLMQYGITDLRRRAAQVKFENRWTSATIEDTTEYYTRVFLHEHETIEEVSVRNVIPTIGKLLLKQLIKQVDAKFDLDTVVKRFSMSVDKNASKARSEKINDLANFASRELFPLSYNGFIVALDSTPAPLIEGTSSQSLLVPQVFSVFRISAEPEVRFGDHHTSANISSGITRFGAYDDRSRDLEIIPFCLSGYDEKMKNLLTRLSQGSKNYRGIERTFNVQLSYPSVNVTNDAHHYIAECERLLEQAPSWVGNADRNRLFLMHIPENQYPVTDISSPYYLLKQFLLEKGIPVQMVDTPTLDNPEYKDLNLALNIVSKVGKTPWVLPSALPDADLFIGLSYAQYKTEAQIYRTIGYANVFNKYGRWEYYKGNAAAFAYEEKHKHLSNLVGDALTAHNNLSESPSIHIHHPWKLSREDRNAIITRAKEVYSSARITFVWQNSGHNIRLFDSKTETNGSLSRGSYVVTRPNQFYLSTTGYNTIKQGLGTPNMLEINIQTDKSETIISHRDIAQHLLALTKLNWASVQSIVGEPVTIKYARNIAQLSSAFLRRTGEFRLHPVLEKTPWFL